jgi:hypothetical protein
VRRSWSAVLRLLGVGLLDFFVDPRLSFAKDAQYLLTFRHVDRGSVVSAIMLRGGTASRVRPVRACTRAVGGAAAQSLLDQQPFRAIELRRYALAAADVEQDNQPPMAEADALGLPW